MPIPDLHDPALVQRLQAKLDGKTKPLGALGRIEALALQIGLILGTESPQLLQPQLVVFAGDHGLAARGVSAYPSDVTWQMVGNFLAGGAAVSVLARQHGLALTVVDCGVRHAFAPSPGLIVRKIAPGTQDASAGPAMSAAQCEQAIANGKELVQGLPGNALLLGEMGIGNTSSASLLLARLTGAGLVDCVGSGTGLDEAGMARKRAILQEVLQLHADAKEPLQALAAFGGFEIATMVGAVLEAAQQRRVILVDGFIASAAVLVACKLEPHVVQRCVFSHRSGECGHGLLLRHLGPDSNTPARALLDLGLRLGEGSGAALAWPLLVSACAVLREMASFGEAGVSTKS
ncbi:nicotinate-nucleotide--dimethylbenzimidazole phosphoribosyltransferase [uncultured Ramlibacter sp.]|uniref:nicotinate-nucleotide--dimethylbenzimidazole phosphoribosyltransferase n=1 Tax=uncultured Ramlibacter sp. TaxID=260755 RepID=UPI00260830A2|nr:nicotinate-nucleotide--dimethylbenzimidazole phosphoribosyltransferase [uncultured Ramlibacter sp.]